MSLAASFGVDGRQQQIGGTGSGRGAGGGGLWIENMTELVRGWKEFDPFAKNQTAEEFINSTARLGFYSGAAASAATQSWMPLAMALAMVLVATVVFMVMRDGMAFSHHGAAVPNGNNKWMMTMASSSSASSSALSSSPASSMSQNLLIMERIKHAESTVEKRAAGALDGAIGPPIHDRVGPKTTPKVPSSTAVDSPHSSSGAESFAADANDALRPFCQDYVNIEEGSGHGQQRRQEEYYYYHQQQQQPQEAVEEADDNDDVDRSIETEQQQQRPPAVVVRSRTPGGHSAASSRMSGSVFGPSIEEGEEEKVEEMAGAEAAAAEEHDWDACGSSCDPDAVGCPFEPFPEGKLGAVPKFPLDLPVVHQEKPPMHFLDAFREAFAADACGSTSSPYVSEVNAADPTAASMGTRNRNPGFAPLVDQCTLNSNAVPGWGFGRDIGTILEPTGFAKDVAPFAAHAPSQYAVGVMAVGPTQRVAADPVSYASARRFIGYRGF